MLNPHEKNTALASQQAKLVLSHEQMTAVCNVLWNHYAALEVDDQEMIDAVKSTAQREEKIIQSVYESLAGCLMAMDQSARAPQ